MEAVDQGGTRSGGKRRPSPTAGDGKRKKRRFVWGDDLHAAFQTAIFDVGLRAATVHAVAGELPAVAPGEHLDAATVEAPDSSVAHGGRVPVAEGRAREERCM